MTQEKQKENRQGGVVMPHVGAAFKALAQQVATTGARLRERYGKIANNFCGYCSLAGNTIFLFSGFGNVSPWTAVTKTVASVKDSVVSLYAAGADPLHQAALSMPPMQTLGSALLFTSGAIFARSGDKDSGFRLALATEAAGLLVGYAPRIANGDAGVLGGMAILSAYWAAGFGEKFWKKKFGASKSITMKHTLGDPRSMMASACLLSIMPPFVQAVARQDWYYTATLSAWTLASASLALSTSEATRKIIAAEKAQHTPTLKL